VLSMPQSRKRREDSLSWEMECSHVWDIYTPWPSASLFC
jgi:hypothetical protein